MLQQAEFLDRANFGRFLNAQGLNGHGVEVGTHRGDFTRELVAQWTFQSLVCVDNYASGYSERDPVSAGNRVDDLNAIQAKLRFRRFRNVRLCLKESGQAAREFSDTSLDFVYIDANHEREAFERDLRLWWPKVKRGGILAGHDIICPGEPLETNWGREIQPALMEFFGAETIFLVVETLALPWSWYVRKP